MEFSVVVVVAAIVAGAFSLYWRQSRKDGVVAATRQFAKRLGIARDRESLHGRVAGAIGRFAIRLDYGSRESEDEASETRLVLDARGALRRTLSIGPEGRLSSLRKSIGDTGVETGDAEFDARAAIGGGRAATLAVLRAETRRRVERALGHGITVENGEIRWRSAEVELNVSRLVKIVEAMVALAEALSFDERPIPTRLLENLRNDEHAGFRRRCLETLVEFDPHGEDTRSALRAALADPEAETRVVAAEKLGDDEDASVVIATVALSHAASDGIRARAVRALAARKDWPRAAATIEKLLPGEDDAPLARVAAVAAAGTLRLARAIPRLETLARSAPPPDAAEAVAMALRDIGDSSGEEAALVLLASNDASVRAAAARALGAIGGRRAVESLHGLATGALPFGSVRAAAIDAIREIQARLVGAGSGALSLSALDDANRGALSLPIEPGGLTTPPSESASPDAAPGKPNAEGA